MIQRFRSHKSLNSFLLSSPHVPCPHKGPLTADGLGVGSSRHTQRRVQSNATTATIVSTDHKQQHQHRHSHLHDENHHHHGVDQQPGAAPTAGLLHEVSSVAHSQLHSDFHTASVTVTEVPCSLGAFAEYVVGRLVREPSGCEEGGGVGAVNVWLPQNECVKAGQHRCELSDVDDLSADDCELHINKRVGSAVGAGDEGKQTKAQRRNNDVRIDELRNRRSQGAE